MARLEGIVIEYVNPKNSSKKCWRCDEFGTRDGKRFVCESSVCHRYQLDSDLNAARNLVKRSKKYP